MRTASSWALSSSISPAATSTGYVRQASQRIAERVKFPAGYYMQWAGQFEYLKAAEERLEVVVPFTLLIIFVLIYLNTQSVDEDGHRPARRALLAGRRVLDALPARL